jgi:hypothetical protein
MCCIDKDFDIVEQDMVERDIVEQGTVANHERLEDTVDHEQVENIVANQEPKEDTEGVGGAEGVEMEEVGGVEGTVAKKELHEDIVEGVEVATEERDKNTVEVVGDTVGVGEDTVEVVGDIVELVEGIVEVVEEAVDPERVEDTVD